MFHTTVLAQDPHSVLVSRKPDAPIHFFAPDALRARAAEFLEGFPGLVTYAVKANPSEEVLAVLCGAGLRGFDVASPAEIEMVRRICPKAAMHYNNPVRSKAEIAYAIEMGVASWSVDDAGEFAKLVKAGVPQSDEISVRFKLPVVGGTYNFGAKFGATEDEAVALLKTVSEAGYMASITFHVGTQCHSPSAWGDYVLAAARIARAAGVEIKRLNVGGGFPASRRGEDVALKPFFTAISEALAAFDKPPALVCEPGRGLVADSYAYAVRVKSVRPGRVYLNDGIYGGLVEFLSMTLPTYSVIKDDGAIREGTDQAAVIFGPTCDSIDTLKEPLPLPADIAEGDWILWRSMGAYLNGLTTGFNGYGGYETVLVEKL